MPNPTIVNRRPDESETDVDVFSALRFGVRDADTRADLETIYSLVAYGRKVYEPVVLPTSDAVLRDNGTSVSFGTFNDFAGVADPNNPCDQTIETVGATEVYRIEKNDLDGVPQEGIVYLRVDAQSTPEPYIFRAQLDLASVSGAPFTGVMLGCAYWPENTGVFAFFVDNGTKSIVVAGPSEADGLRTSTEVTVPFDWSLQPYTYSLVIDPTPFRRQVSLFATDSAGVETLLAELDLDTFPEFLESVTIGGLRVEDRPTEFVTFLVGGVFPFMGDYIDIYGFDILDFGRVTVVNGSPSGASSLTVIPTESIHVNGPDGASEWLKTGTAPVELTPTSLRITATSGDNYYSRVEPDLAAGEWFVVGMLAGEDSIHEGQYSTGMGLWVEDGLRAYKLMLLDDFSRFLVGIEDSSVLDDPTVVGYKLAAEEIFWTLGITFTMVGSASRDSLRVYIDSQTQEAIEHVYSSAGLPSASSDSHRVRFGFVEPGTLSGSFFLQYLWVFPAAVLYEPVDGTFPEAQGWTRTFSGMARDVSSVLTLDAASVGRYDIYSISDTTYSDLSGAAAHFHMSLDAWVDSEGALNPLRTAIGPVAAVRTSTVAVQVYFTRLGDGSFRVYLPSEDADLQDVLDQTALGQLISAPVDMSLSTPRTFLLVVKPRNFVRLFLDNNPEPVIDVPWSSVGAVEKALPANMPSDAVLAFGSLGEETGVAASFYHFRGSLGEGYDLAVTPQLTEAELQSHVYGSTADVLIDVFDKD